MQGEGQALALRFPTGRRGFQPRSPEVVMRARVPVRVFVCLNRDFQDYRISKIRKSLVEGNSFSR